MDADKDEDLMYETVDDLPVPNKSPVSSTGSISDEDEDIQINTNERRQIDWNEGRLNDYNIEDRVILKPRHSSEFPRSNFGIETPQEPDEISEDQIQELYEGLGVNASNNEIRPSVIYIQSLKPISIYEVEKIFAEYNPIRSALLTSKSAVVKFETNLKAAEAMIGLTMRLVRVRKETAQEDGEIAEDDDTADVHRNQHCVVVRKDGSRKRKQMSNTIELDVDEVEIPTGNWQVVCKHVPKGRHIFVRFAVGFEVRQSMINPYREEVSENLDEPKPLSNDPDDFSGTFDSYKKQRVKPGINVFKEDGTELAWNFEHDTRFYQDTEGTEGKEPIEQHFESTNEEIVTKSGDKIRSRGRGSKKFMEAFMDSDSD